MKGRKTDVADCRRIQKLFSAGILRNSFIPEGKFMELRQLVRERLDIIEMGGSYVNKMQKCLEMMNIKLKNVISQVHGASGIRLIKSIIGGERDPQVLLSLCDSRIIREKGDKVLKALEGKYNDTFLFMLAQNLEMWEHHQKQVGLIDKEIEKLLNDLKQSQGQPLPTSRAKKVRHHGPDIDDLHGSLVQIFGVDLSTISGFNDYTLLRLVAETGTDMGRFPSAKHFASWCGLSPKNHQTGKIKKRVKGTAPNQAGQIFKMSAQALINSKFVAIGSFIRKLRARKDPATAIKAGARKLAMAYYNALTKGLTYVEQGVKKYEEQIRQKEMYALQKLAVRLNFKLIRNEAFT